MSFSKRACPIGLLVAISMAAIPGCSGGGTAEGGAAPASSKPRHPLTDVADVYRAGNPVKAREMALQYADRAIADIELEKVLELKLGQLLQVAVTAEMLTQFETQLAKSTAKPPDASSRQAVIACLERMEKGQSLVADQLGATTLTQREREAVSQIDGYRTSAITNWIIMNPPEQRMAVFRDHQKFLESQGVKAADLMNTTDSPAFMTPLARPR
jgi:hypothetical protein